MAQVILRVAGSGVHLEGRSIRGREALGEATRIELEALSPEPIEAAAVLGKACAVTLSTSLGERVLHGIVARFVAIATAQATAARRCELTVCSAIHLLSLRRRTRVFQHLTVPAIVEAVLADAGIQGDRVTRALAADHEEREYVVQYAEDDLSFVRRLCEEEGLHFRFEPGDGFDALVLEDTSGSAPRAPGRPLPLVDGAELSAPGAVAWGAIDVRRRRPGKVVLRDHDPEHPAARLEGVAEGGGEAERRLEVYLAPGRFTTPSGGTARARLALESLRAEARSIRFRTTSLALAPGLAFALEPSADHRGSARPEGAFLVVSVEHDHRAGSPRYELDVTAIPLAVPFRLPRATPRPRIAGLHPAIVTGPAGQEIHADAAGRVRVRFFWDREGPTDHGSSLPVRVAQPNLPGSMLIPRVGWEVLVAFEDGDPDRPFVVGRAYNARQPPPFPLPANKTITSLSTASSPGGAKKNSVHFDDAGGRQHLAWSAGTGRTTVVANDMMTQTAGNEVCSVGGAQSYSIGGDEKISVKQVFLTNAASQSLTVGGSQSLTVLGDVGVTSGSEAVVIGGALIEKIGNPVDGVIGLAKAAAVTVAGSAGSEYLEKYGRFAQHAFNFGLAVADGAVSGGETGAELGAAGALLSHFPGADVILPAIEGTGHAPWDTPPEGGGDGAAAPGGGAGGPGAAAGGPAGPGPGHRVFKVDGAMTQIIGGPHGVMTPGMVRWTSLGRSLFAVAGSHNIQAADVSVRSAGVSVESGASLTLQATGAFIARSVKGTLHRTVGGSLSIAAGKDQRIRAGGALSITTGGSLDMSGSIVVFKCGGSTLSASSGGVLLKGSSITINGEAVQRGKATTP